VGVDVKPFALYFLAVLASWRFDLICLSSVSSVSSVSKLLKPIAITALWLALCRPVAAAEFTFAALGDTPYTRFEEAHFPGLLAGMGREELAFAVHVGDFKAARARCSDETFLQRRNWFNAAPLPFVFVPGDNEWTDCGGVQAGGYEPLERLAKLRELFFRGEDSLGQRQIRLERHGPGYPEHARWRHEDVLFLTLNVPGNANNARDMPEEFRSRSAAVDQWLEKSFGLARGSKLRAVVIFMQANPWASPSSRYFGYRDLLATLAREALAFDGEVLLVHGDTHRYRVDAPLRDPATGAPVANFTRVEVFGSPGMNWVRIRVAEDAGRVGFEVTPGNQ
jgi:hypothetical protein